MSDSPAAGASPHLLDGIRRHLEGLKRTADGRTLYNLIERGLQRYGGTRDGLERAFVTFLYSLLGKYAKDPQYDPATRIKARLIQQRLVLHLTAAPPAAAEKTEKETAEAAAPETDTPGTGAAEMPAVELAQPPPSAAMPEPPAVSSATGDGPAALPETPAVAKATAELAGVSEAMAQRTDPPEAENGDRAALQDDLAGRLIESLAPAAAEPLRDFGELRQILVQGIDGLIREREALLQKINHAAEYLKSVEADRRRLAEELRKTRAHSLSDELTGLPRREVFLKSLEAEIGRVRRYGFAFALALIDIDGLGEFNARHGREAGDAVLRCYAQEILSRFRAYDLVARYGDDEFAILFPNTQKDGALRALEKARQRAASTYLQHDGKSLPLPGFSSVLTMYAQGEKPQTLLARAAEALDQARLKGRDQLVVALPTH